HGVHLDLHPFPTRRSSDLCFTGVNRPGRAIDARTALTVEPERSQISAPLCKAVATTPKGMSNSSIGRSRKFLRKKAISRSPLSIDRKSTRLNSSHVKISYA